MAEFLTAVGYRPHSFLWSEKEYQHRELVDDFQHLLPFVAMVTQGYCGKDEPIQMFASDQLFWLRDIAYQRRLVCRDSNSKYYSIPLCYTKEVIPSKRNGNEGPLMSISEMVLKGIYISFSFEPGCWHSIKRNGDRFQYKDLGTLKIVDTYYERFLVVHSLLSRAFEEPPTHLNPRGFHNNKGVHSKFTLIPLYVLIAFVVAVGVSETEDENFNRTMFNLREFVNTLPANYDDVLKQNSDIVTFEEIPPGGDYEYIHSLKFLSYAKHIDIDDDTEEYCTIGDVTETQPNIVAIPESDVPPDRPRKPGMDKKSILSSSQAVPNLLKKKTSKQRAIISNSNLKNRAPSPLSDSSDDSDDIDYEEFQANEEAPYLLPVPSPLTFVPTPLKYRDEPVALGVDVEVVLGQLNNLLLSGVIPKSSKNLTPSKAKVVMPDILPRHPIASDKIDYELVDFLSPPTVPERKTRGSACRGNVRVPHQEMTLPNSSGPPGSQHPRVETRVLSTPAAQPISMSDILHSKLTLKTATGRKHRPYVKDIEHSDINERGTTEVLEKSSRKAFTGNPAGTSDRNEKLTTTNSELKSQESLHTSFHTETGDTPSETAAVGDSSMQNELKSILAKRRQMIQKPNIEEENIKITATKHETHADSKDAPVCENLGLISKSSMQLSMEDTKRVFHVESHDSKIHVGENSRANVVHQKQERVHSSNVAIIQPQAKTKPLIPAKIQKPKVTDNPKPKLKTGDSHDDDNVNTHKLNLKVLSNDIVNGASIPKDVSAFNVGDVARCLQLLNMSEHVEEFLSQQIDGALLQFLDEAMLQAEFGFKRMMARKLVMFARDGWRLNV